MSMLTPLYRDFILSFTKLQMAESANCIFKIQEEEEEEETAQLGKEEEERRESSQDESFPCLSRCISLNEHNQST